MPNIPTALTDQARPGAISRIARQAQLSDEIADHIRHQIMTGQIRSGEFLRLERFAEELGVSVTPVREAMFKLRGDGFVSLAARRGFRVSPLTADDVRDVYFVQAKLAGELARRSCAAMTPDRIEVLRDLHEQFKRAIADGERETVTRVNHTFHREINILANSPKLAWFLENALTYSPHVYFDQIPGWTELALETQPRLIEILANKDSRGIVRELDKYLTTAGDLLIQYLDGLGIWDESAPGDVAAAP